MMKKYFLFLGIALLTTLQSCSMYSETVFHKEPASSTQIDIDFKEAMQFVKSMMPDSIKDGQKMQEMDKLPKVWTNFYDMQLKDGKKVKNPDSVKIMKKMFVKSNFQDGEIAGISMKLDRFTKADFDFLDKSPKNEKLPVNTSSIKDWNGKTLTIDTKSFSLDNLEKLMNETSGDKKLSKEEQKEQAEQMKSMMQMMDMKITNVMKFENKIKSVTGKHDWVQQVDDHTIKITYSSADLVDEKKKLKNKDEKITIVTE